VLALEQQLLEPSVRGDRAVVDRLLDKDFTEVGSSGRLWTREAALEELEASPGTHPPDVHDMSGAFVDGNTVLVTYRSERDGREVHRSSLWIRTDTGWRVRYHQGTPTT
jgi:ribonuclease HI